MSQRTPLGGKPNITSSEKPFAPTKRPFVPSVLDEFDSENIDPAALCSPTKKSKSDGVIKPFNFTLSPSKAMPPPPMIPSRLSTPSRANMSSPRAPMTAPAGRSPKRKTAGIMKYRRTSAPFTRIDPPFGSRSSGTLPFSLDAALSGTLSTAKPKDEGATIQESMPKNWFFEIYEDTPEEEAANLMEHSTLTLDLSSDEESSKTEKNDRGKENVAPEGYDAPTASRAVAAIDASEIAAPRHVRKTEIVRKKVHSDEMDDGERSPLSDLETESFFSEGLDKDSHVLVDPTPEKPVITKLDVKELFAVPAASTASSTPSSKKTSRLSDMPLVNSDGDVKGDIIVWEDSPVSEASVSDQFVVEASPKTGGKRKQTFDDENNAPLIDKTF